jgi:hypothetical protein
LISDCAPWDFPKSTKAENYDDKIQETIEARSVNSTSPLKTASGKRVPSAVRVKVKRVAKTPEPRLANLTATQEAFGRYPMTEKTKPKKHPVSDQSGPRRKTDREVISSMPQVAADDPIFTGGFRIGMTRLRNSSTKPIKGDK